MAAGAYPPRGTHRADSLANLQRIRNKKRVPVQQLTFVPHVTKGNAILSRSEGRLASRAGKPVFCIFYSFQACLRSRVL